MTDKTKNNRVVATGKLTKEQQEILDLVQTYKYSARELRTLLFYFNKLELIDFVANINIHIADYLASVDSVGEREMPGLCGLFMLNCSLAEIAHNFAVTSKQ